MRIGSAQGWPMVQHLNWKLKQNLLVPAPFAVVGAVDIASPFIDVHPVARGDLDLCGFPFFLLYTVKVFWFLFFSYIVKFADERSWGSLDYVRAFSCGSLTNRCMLYLTTLWRCWSSAAAGPLSV